MRCPACLCEDTYVVDSRPQRGRIRRRHECVKCEHRFNTIEITLGEYNALTNEAADIKNAIRKIQNVLTAEE